MAAEKAMTFEEWYEENIFDLESKDSAKMAWDAAIVQAMCKIHYVNDKCDGMARDALESALEAIWTLHKT